jgi:hypothetical protein
MPAFFVVKSGNKNLTNGQWLTADLNAVVFDTNSWYDDTNYRYTPQIAGYYQLSSSLYIRAASGLTQIACGIAKNSTSGIGIFGDYVYPGSAASGSCSVSGLVYMNGSTDYVESVCYSAGTSPFVDGTGTGGVTLGTAGVFYGSFLSGFLVRPD